MILRDDIRRHRYLLLFHFIDSFTFLLRFVIICTDLSAASNRNSFSSLSYSIPILVLELIGSLTIFSANILYILLRYIGTILYESDDDDICIRRKYLWSLSTLTCFKSINFYYNHPQAILLTRFGILIGCFLLRFIAFVLSCECARRYSPRGIAYAVIGCVSLIPSFVTIVIEYLHYRRLWSYRPNADYNVQTHPSHIRYIPYPITNDQRTTRWRVQKCPVENCTSDNLNHILIFHSSDRQYRPQGTGDNQIVIGFHQTRKEVAYKISSEGFRTGPIGMMGPGVYFATSLDHTEFKARQFGAYICAKVNLGRVFRTTQRGVVPPGSTYDTIYFVHPEGSDEFCVLRTEQILVWIIIVYQDSRLRFEDQSIHDRFDGSVYEGCL
ncbi:unnamed protein product [Didymodactylos carnosus]|uniref:PARP catalytic domain-containing protein n=1 Tax=Didymodactylos carnosus TaxID=1234261 RepID=A0A815MKG4_9BILA|nr:unnamed protein product [Didymodactylos carnosus]CAF1424200.1 unnamed protein product [Didymodactylos carnosus]CAF3816267.1 unnamed protein product [Didymodactylos carnosus]CAF4305672.1 unnamed protein product [Didymodactylos carnosus]